MISVGNKKYLIFIFFLSQRNFQIELIVNNIFQLNKLIAVELFILMKQEKLNEKLCQNSFLRHSINKEQTCVL